MIVATNALFIPDSLDQNLRRELARIVSSTLEEKDRDWFLPILSSKCSWYFNWEDTEIYMGDDDGFLWDVSCDYPEGSPEQENIKSMDLDRVMELFHQLSVFNAPTESLSEPLRGIQEDGCILYAGMSFLNNGVLPQSFTPSYIEEHAEEVMTQVSDLLGIPLQTMVYDTVDQL